MRDVSVIDTSVPCASTTVAGSTCSPSVIGSTAACAATAVDGPSHAAGSDSGVTSASGGVVGASAPPAGPAASHDDSISVAASATASALTARDILRPMRLPRVR